jgi:DNA-binding transcriptional LysR family regulator
VQLQVPHYLTIPAIVASTDLLGTVPWHLARHFVHNYGLQLAELPFETPAVQVSLIWHRQQQHMSGLQWLKEQIAQVAQTESS